MSLYLEHFKLRELPFRLTPAVAFFYRGCVRGETLDALKYAIGNGEGIMAVIGEVGAGKSMLCRMLMTDLQDSLQIAYIANPSFSDLEIVYHIAEELEIDISGEHHQVARSLQSHLLELHRQGRGVLVCIDEAQAMPDSSLEQIRLLSNLETSNEKVIQIVMFGQPELSAKLGQQHMRQLRERITSTFFLRNLNIDEVREYITHRLQQAGHEGKDIFSSGAVAIIAKVSEGLSRRINILCDKAMLAAFAENSAEVKASHAEQAARDARYKRMGGQTASGSAGLQRKAAFSWLAVLLAAGAVSWQLWRGGENAEPAPQATQTTIGVQQAPAAPVSPSLDTGPAAAPPKVEVAPAAPAAPRPADRQPIALVDNLKWSAYPPSSYLRQRLNTTETLFRRSDDPDLYTARILTVPRSRAVEIERYLRDLARFFTVRNVMIYPARSEGRDVFVITYGSYPSEFQAELFIHELPSFFRDDRPYVQALAVSQLEAADHW